MQLRGHQPRRAVHRPGAGRCRARFTRHPDADELQYYISGKARMTVFDAVNNARTFDFEAGDVGYVPKTLAHYIENTGDEPMRVVNVFHTGEYKDVSLNNWLAPHAEIPG